MLRELGHTIIETVFRIICRIVMTLAVGFVFFAMMSFPTPFSRTAVVGDDVPERPPVSPETVAIKKKDTSGKNG